MDHYADAQMHAPVDRPKGHRLALTDDSVHGFNIGSNQEVQVPIMTADESRRYADQWQNRVGSVTQVMWFEIAGCARESRCQSTRQFQTRAPIPSKRPIANTANCELRLLECRSRPPSTCSPIARPPSPPPLCTIRTKNR